MFLSWILTVYLEINSQPSRFNQSQYIDKLTHQEVPFELRLRMNLVGLEDTEPRMVPSNAWKSSLRLSRPKTSSARLFQSAIADAADGREQESAGPQCGPARTR